MLHQPSRPDENDKTSVPVTQRPALLALILLVGATARTYDLVGPPLDHHWYRQYETAALARNFYEGGMSILYPQVDWGGETPGYVESEFPIYPYCVGLLYKLAGPHEWLARLVNIAIYVFSALLLYRLTGKVYDSRAALIAVAFYSVLPVSFFFTRDIQADALAALATLGSLYYFSAWTERDRWYAFVLSAVGTATAVLIKPSNLYLGVPLVYLLYTRDGWRFVFRWQVWLYAAAVLVPMWLWYSHAFVLWQHYGNTFFRAYVGATLPSPSDGIWLTFGYKLLQRLVQVLATPPGVVLLALGALSLPARRGYLLHWWALGFLISMLVAPEPHALHDYYQLPIVFVIAAFMARGFVLLLEGDVARTSVAVGLSLALASLVLLLARNPLSVCLAPATALVGTLLVGALLLLHKPFATRALSAGLATIIVVYSVWQVAQFFPDEQWHRDRVSFGKHIQELTETDAKVVFLSVRAYRPGWYQHRTSQGEILYHDCVDFYLSHRKGWSLGLDQASPALIESLRQRGARYVCYCLGDFSLLLNQHPDMSRTVGKGCKGVEVTPLGAIYRLESSASSTNAQKEPPRPNPDSDLAAGVGPK